MRNLKTINSLKAYINKEIIEGIRTHRFLIIAAGIMFFSIADPLMVKLMPTILDSQLKGVDLSSIIELSQRAAMKNFTKDLYQLSSLVIVLTLMGIVSGEKSGKTLTIPVSMGCNINGILAGKALVYGGCLMAICIAGMSSAYYYSGMIFGFDYESFVPVLRAGFLYGVYFWFVLSLLMFFSSFIEKPFVAGIVTLLVVYLIPLLNSIIRGVGRYLPSNLLTEANYFGPFVSRDLAVTLICTLGLVLIFNTAAIVKLEKTEFV